MEATKQYDQKDTSYLNNEESTNYCKFLGEQNMHLQPQYYLHNFPTMDNKLREILESLIQINPYFRHSAKEVLSSEIFNSVRVPELE